MRARGGTRIRREDAVALTRRQEEVLRLLERGYTNSEIAAALGISLDGAKFHVGEIIGKLGVATREEAVEAWRQRRRERVTGLAFVGLRCVGGGVAVAGVAALAVAWIALGLRDDEAEDAGGVAASPSATIEASPTASPSATVYMVGCPDSTPTPSSFRAVIDWIDFVQFEGVSYMGSGFFSGGGGILQIPQSSLGKEYGRVAFKLAGNMFDPGYRARDCDASFLNPGSVLYTVNGYDPRFRIALANGRVYESYRGDGVRVAGDITDLRGKVSAIEFRGPTETVPQVVGGITSAAEVSRLVDLFLGAEFDDARVPTPAEYDLPSVQLVFVLSDGTEFVRGYQPDIGRVWPGIWVPEAFNEAARAAMGGQ